MPLHGSSVMLLKEACFRVHLVGTILEWITINTFTLRFLILKLATVLDWMVILSSNTQSSVMVETE
jgi:hypothetical protein